MKINIWLEKECIKESRNIVDDSFHG